ncbi:RNA-binding domain-containing protein [Annulohypoxylon maeteangense]|uniref:RNA-binding domain-containing protein n=1 Tax=Annulohypoxylon maeteangense TaxID=1927788 RepID=UPI0020079587|nr:RNA-binding domain-containing protein [Annulohypoxylon maeteangense]KAI0884464.1 RNA-binding domain-containing protein [Annulohypoxylon maeteangense]
MSGAKHWEQDKEATVYVGNIDERATDALIWELMVQAGPVVNVHLPKDRVTQSHQGFGFVEFNGEVDADYAAKIMNGIRLYGKALRVNKASADKQKPLEIGAELFIGNLDPMVDEKVLYDTFSRFGTLIAPPKVARDDNGLSKGYGFVSYSSFEASDDAINNMNGQFLMNKDVSVQYAYKKDGKGERHGDEAERMLAAQAKKHNVTIESQPMPPGLLQTPTPATPAPAAVAPPVMATGGFDPSMAAGIPPPRPPVGFAPPPNSHRGPPPPFGVNGTPMPPGAGRTNVLPPAPQGLPARPPPSQAGYGSPADFHPGGFRMPPPGFGPPGSVPPPPPPGFTPGYGR